MEIWQKPASPSPNAPRSKTSGAVRNGIALSAVIASILALEVSKWSGVQVPLPFFLLYGSVAITSGIAGLRVGLVGASFVAIYMAYAASIDVGQSSLKLAPLRIAAELLIPFVIAYFLGKHRNTRLSRQIGRRGQDGAGQEPVGMAQHQFSHLENVDSIEDSDPRLLKNAVMHSSAGVIFVGKNNRIEYINPAAMSQFGLDGLPDDWRNISVFIENVEIFTPRGERYRFTKGPLVDALKDGNIADDFEFRVRHSDRTDGWLHGYVSPTKTINGDITGATVILLNIGDKVIAKRFMQQVARRLLNAQEEERAKIAYQLNDDVAQQLAAVKMMLYTTHRAGVYEKRIEESIIRINSLLDSVKSLSMELRPAALDDLGLLSALRMYLTSQPRNENLEITLDANISIPNLSPEIAIACFRIVEEAVSNAIQHANARSLIVKMQIKNAEICMDIVDDGVGFDVGQAIRDGIYRNGVGLIAMRERTKIAGGQFVLTSAPGQGTKVSACFPNS